MSRAAPTKARPGPVMICGPLLLLLLAPASPADDIARPAWQASRVALDRCLAREEFRIFFTLEGKDALPEPARADADGDGTPDRIQDLALQLITARQMYVEVMGLRHPFLGPRYRGRVRFFDVHVLEMPNNGTAGDAIVNYQRPTDPTGGVEVLTIDIDRDIGARNLTPAHELFHEFQNGYTLFKNGWYTEGTARWSEHAFREGAGPAGTLPRNSSEVERLFSQRYEASGFWNALARAADATGEIRVPAPLMAARYIGDPKPIIEDARVHGVALIRALLEELDRADDVASLEGGLDPLDWPEARQRGAENNPAIWKAVTTACRRYNIELPNGP